MPLPTPAICQAAERNCSPGRPLTRKERIRWLRECRRLRGNYRIERRLGAPYISVGAVDEAGRGPLAGPVVAAAVILPLGCMIPGLDDSKKLGGRRRSDLYAHVMRNAVSVGVAGAGPGEIDEVGIGVATRKAMRRAVSRLNPQPGVLIVDGNETLPGVQLQQLAVVGGDGRSNSAAAASVVAKVIRDGIMQRHAEEFPAYGFHTNVGYGTGEHRRALQCHGPTPLHRASFLTRLQWHQMDLFADQ